MCETKIELTEFGKSREANDYPETRRIIYESGAVFVPVCEKCNRFVKPNATIRVSGGEGLAHEPNAQCAKCGATNMLFEGFV